MADVTVYRRVNGVRLNVRPTAVTLRQGRQGPTGPAGADGADGPSTVTTSTTTPLDGLIAGDGSTIYSLPLTTYQPLDSDLTAIATLSTTSFGRALLTLASAAAGRSALELGSASLLDASNVPLLNAANTFSAGPQVFVGGATVRQSGGTAGTDEVQISHDGTQAIFSDRNASKGRFYFSGTGADCILLIGGNSPTSPALRPNGPLLQVVPWNETGHAGITAGVFRTLSSGVFGWAPGNDPSTTPDTALARASERVVGLTNGSTAGATLSSVPLTLSQITADQNNYFPFAARFYRLSSDATRTITGLVTGGGQVNGQECEFWNVGGFNIVLAHQSASSTAANRFICTGGANITLAPDEIALLRYDATTSRWRVRKV